MEETSGESCKVQIKTVIMTVTLLHFVVLLLVEVEELLKRRRKRRRRGRKRSTISGVFPSACFHCPLTLISSFLSFNVRLTTRNSQLIIEIDLKMFNYRVNSINERRGNRYSFQLNWLWITDCSAELNSGKHWTIQGLYQM